MNTRLDGSSGKVKVLVMFFLNREDRERSTKMKKVMLICLIAGLSFSKSVSADDASATSQSAVEAEMSQGVVVSGPGYSSADAKGGESSADAYSGIYWDYSPTSIMRYPKYIMPPVQPGTAPLTWPFPPQWFLWNTVAKQDVMVFQREWKIRDVRDSLRQIDYKGPVEFLFHGILSGNDLIRGKGFKWQTYLFDRKLRPKNKPTVTTIVQDVNMVVFSQNYTCIGLIGMETEDKLFIAQTIAGAIESVSIYDWDVGFLRPGMNLVNASSGVSSGASGVSGGIHNTFALVAGVSSGKAKVTGEGAVSLILYRKNGKEKISEGVSEIIVEKDEERSIPKVEVSPELQELYRKAEVNGRFQGRSKNDKTNQSVEERIWSDVFRKAEGN